jgi:hypothetical protein
MTADVGEFAAVASIAALRNIASCSLLQRDISKSFGNHVALTDLTLSSLASYLLSHIWAWT